jgi:nitroimidazol reductase NimA-like FMN-containing flavoprotein (pyridoxamine 5'-phosphate oxidase superfamily)
MSREPTPTAPLIPTTYGVPTDGSGGERLPWSWTVERLTDARNYWICTTCPDGRPHAAPVWGVWLDGAVWFATARASRKSRNLAANPAVIIHLESGDETVILEGSAEEVHDIAALERFVDAYAPKYGIRPDTADEGNIVYVLRPVAAQTWEERNYPRTATRWLFSTG